MNTKRLISAFFVAILSAWASVCFGSSSSYIPLQHLNQVDAWLKTQEGYRLATIEDCDCLESIVSLRKGDGAAWKPKPNYEPYYATGDFDGDGIKDFAVIVRPIIKEDEAKVLVFLSGQSGKSAIPLVYPLRDKTIRGIGLFLGRSRGNVAKLLVGAFSSEAEELPIPKSSK
jgi:hypothetical protein